MSILDFHVLLALANGPLYGYALRDAVTQESSGAVDPRAGTLYRVVARLMTAGLVTEAHPDHPPPPHPGHARRYYRLTASGKRALAAEAHRLQGTAALVEARLGMAEGHP